MAPEAPGHKPAGLQTWLKKGNNRFIALGGAVAAVAGYAYYHSKHSGSSSGGSASTIPATQSGSPIYIQPGSYGGGSSGSSSGSSAGPGGSSGSPGSGGSSGSPGSGGKTPIKKPPNHPPRPVNEGHGHNFVARGLTKAQKEHILNWLHHGGKRGRVGPLYAEAGGPGAHNYQLTGLTRAEKLQIQAAEKTRGHPAVKAQRPKTKAATPGGGHVAP